jgi:hypothetical protein
MWLYGLPEGWTILGATIRHRGGQTQEIDADEIIVVPVTSAARRPTPPVRTLG